jgi:hypothetical protein
MNVNVKNTNQNNNGEGRRVHVAFLLDYILYTTGISHLKIMFVNFISVIECNAKQQYFMDTCQRFTCTHSDIDTRNFRPDNNMRSYRGADKSLARSPRRLLIKFTS